MIKPSLNIPSKEKQEAVVDSLLSGSTYVPISRDRPVSNDLYDYAWLFYALEERLRKDDNGVNPGS